MNSNEKLIRDFYTAFSQKNAADMQACYHPEVSFSDPVFPLLKGAEAGAMWAMLCEQGKDLQLSFDNIKADERQGTCTWEAIYTFSKSGRKVHNIIRANFEFRDGKIIEHRDYFDFYRWTRMALGTPGILLGWTPMVKNKVRQTAAQSLRNYMMRKT